ncbi:hypothetical protein CDD83_1201 [Cordyceps sp. RAO-2017]|nr:hypothetical protein CDD83_1201 [Cordyceps sp. RAO-2017]
MPRNFCRGVVRTYIVPPSVQCGDYSAFSKDSDSGACGGKMMRRGPVTRWSDQQFEFSVGAVLLRVHEPHRRPRPLTGQKSQLELREKAGETSTSPSSLPAIAASCLALRPRLQPPRSSPPLLVYSSGHRYPSSFGVEHHVLGTAASQHCVVWYRRSEKKAPFSSGLLPCSARRARAPSVSLPNCLKFHSAPAVDVFPI